ncbi:MAG: hypothetical protein IT223_00800, partial [Crocinitomicaceae bacterium]|nr:hypothetical protein [Crocinitomicaceae bacterium]
WKATSIYGAEFTANQCITAASQFDWLGIKCNNYFSNPSYINNHSVSLSYFATVMIVNGVRIVNELSGMPSSGAIIKYSLNCSGSDNYTNQSFSCANRGVNPNLMPMWIPAGTTVKTGGPNTFISVIEFNIIP